MSRDNRPDADRILAMIQLTEAKARSGKLRLFFGMSAGVGKTYAMLKAAHERVKEGRDLIVGTVDTHGRSETEALLQGLDIIPRKTLEYRGTLLQEMDIDAILTRRPQLVLVDELAHTNAPGSRHPKRWHDVVELLDAGIDVYSTLNVQHVESRKEAVEEIVEISIRESVPDVIVERASQITLVDITPPELLQRLREGKVYLGDRAETALNHFFQEDKLTALREISLRFTAEKVDHELQVLRSSGEQEQPWKATDRLMVAVSHSPHSEGLVRATRRLAFSLEAPWIAVHVDTGENLSERDKLTLARNLNLVRELGGELINTADTDIADALRRVAREQNVTQLIVGRPARRWMEQLLLGGSILDRLAHETTTFDIHVLKPSSAGDSSRSPRLSLKFESSVSKYWFTLWVMIAVALVSWFMQPLVGYRAVGFVFLLGVLGVSLLVSIGPTVFAALLAVLTWDYFFIPPKGTFHISEPEDVAMCVAMLVTALVTGILTGRIRRREQMLRRREERTNVLYQIASAISAAPDRRALAWAVTGNLSYLLHGEIGLALKTETGDLAHIESGPASYWMTVDKEWTVALWAYEHGKMAGWSTDTLPLAASLYVPLVGPTETVGVLAFRPRSDTRLSLDESNLLSAVARQVAVATELELSQERSRHMRQMAESERLHQTVLNSVSHELRTPLTALIGNASALQNDRVASNQESRQQLTEELIQNASRLNRVVENLLDMSRLSSGTLKLNLEWHDPADLVTVVVDALKRELANHVVVVQISPSTRLIKMDFRLCEQALTNVLLNAATYTPPRSRIVIDVAPQGAMLRIRVSDNGPGIPESSLSLIFDKFYRVPMIGAGGTGLGLSIAKEIIELHGGTVAAGNAPEHGAVFDLFLPAEAPPDNLFERDT